VPHSGEVTFLGIVWLASVTYALVEYVLCYLPYLYLFGACEGVLGFIYSAVFNRGSISPSCMIGWGWDANTGGLLSSGVNWMVMVVGMIFLIDCGRYNRHITRVRLALLKVTSGLRICAVVVFEGSSKMPRVGYV